MSMAIGSDAAAHESAERPLLSTKTVVIAFGLVVTILGLTLGMTLFGARIGAALLLGDHSDRLNRHIITIGVDQLALEENTIRFPHQRQTGSLKRVDLMLLWPEMRGYDAADRQRFDNLSLADGLIFLDISQSTMSRDMTGRVEPIYSQLFDGPGQAAEFGLTAHTFKTGSGYDGEILYTAQRPGQSDYAIRCLGPTLAAQLTSGDCQRDIHFGEDLTVLYRFSRNRLADWQAIDAAVLHFLEQRRIAPVQVGGLKGSA